jgi:hypothetical protein
MTIKTFVTLICLLFYLNNAQSQTEGYPPARYSIDSLEWLKLCEPTYRNDYYHYSAKNNKSSYQILKEWQSVFKKPADFKQTGFLTIKFIINCRLELCCFHIYEMDDRYQPIAFDENVKAQLMTFINNLGGWKVVEEKGKPTNYRYYLNFVIKNGEFKRVSP